ncbi:MAG: NAD(+)/NADH kinase [Bacteroidetes bacterium]|nr:NAD(+)/NADH kinase [Bacteroidota bacterium]MCH8523427.1 NAD(+)/NADH kinase [Balneolales bacterium]
MKFAVIALTSRYPVADTLSRVVSWFGKHPTCELMASKQLEQYLDIRQLNQITLFNSDEEAVSHCDTVISIGGDGTLLRTARLVMGTEKPVLGINSGRLGFLANIPQDRLEEALAFTSQQNYRVDKRFMLEATMKDGKKHHALNEFLFSKGHKGSLITLTASYNGEFINKYWSDGIIVAGPTGSTAYNMSCGGPIITPGTNVMILNPINPHTLTTRPLVLDASNELTIRVSPENQDVTFSKDGEICDISSAELEVRIRRSDFIIHLITLPGQSYFDTLRKKLMWGMDIRDTFTNT